MTTVKKIKKVRAEGILVLRERQIKISNYLEEWDAIKAWLNEEPQTLNEIRKTIIKSANMGVRAKSLYEEGRKEKRKNELEYKDSIQILRRDALEYWEKKKKEGMRKQITESMIEDRIIEENSKIYKNLTNKKNEISAIVSTLDSLYEAVITKGNDLRKLLDSESRLPRTPKYNNV